MKEDFYYYCIGTPARAEGFAEDDALTVAYASQYVDDATESEPLQVGDTLFDPERDMEGSSPPAQEEQGHPVGRL